MQPITPQVGRCNGTTLVIGHGRAHQIIHEWDYDRCVFLDQNSKVRPDIVADFRIYDPGVS